MSFSKSVLPVLLVVVAAGVVIFASSLSRAKTEADAPVATEAPELGPRFLGEEDAPVVVEEYASLSCSHCAHFHQKTFPELKEQYIDTGKVKFIYRNFPLNASALEAAMVARCLPEDKYFSFLSFLFETQGDWAYGREYRDYLQANAKLLGLGEEEFDACLSNDELRRGLVGQRLKAQRVHEIESTPSFVINGEHVVRGAVKFKDLKPYIDSLLPAEPVSAE